MPFGTIEAYIERLPDRMAEMRSLLVEASAWPHMSRADRNKADKVWARRVSKQPHPERLPAKLLPMIGIGVKYI